MFFKPQEDSHSIQLIKFYCGSTCLYFPLLTISVLCTNLMYESGRFKFLPFVGLMVVAECLKYIFMNGYYKEAERHFSRYAQKTNGATVKKWLSEKKIKEVVKGLVFIVLVTSSYFIIAVLFGAEFLSKNEETFMLSILLTVLTALPPCIHLGPNFALAAILGDETNSLNPLSPVLQHVVRVTLLGAWLGAFVIPLDWDRPWQEWPVPCCVGALMGYVAAHATAMIQVAIPYCARNRMGSKLS